MNIKRSQLVTKGYLPKFKSDLKKAKAALQEIAKPHKTGGSSLDEWLRCNKAARECLAELEGSGK